jgi:WD40 repeat protein
MCLTHSRYLGNENCILFHFIMSESHEQCGTWWNNPIIPELRRLTQEDHEFKGNLGYTARLSLKKKDISILIVQKCFMIRCINQHLSTYLNEHFGEVNSISFPNSFYDLNFSSFHLDSKGHPCLGLECRVEAWSFINVSFIISWTIHQSYLRLCFVQEEKMIFTFLTSFQWLHLDAKLVLSCSHNFISSLA